MKAAKNILFLVFISLFTASALYAQWEKLIVNGDTRVFNIFTVNDNLFVFAGPTDGSYPPTQLFMSTDDGNSFTDLSQSLPDSVTGLYAIEWHNGMTFLGTDNGIYASSDLGTSWVKKNNGISSKYNYSLTSDGDYLYAGFTGSIYRSNNNGDNWEILQLPLNLQFELSIIRQIERSDSTLYVLSGNTPMNMYKLNRKFDEFSMSKLYTGNLIRDFSVNKSGSNITIAKFYSSGGSGMFYSNDYGNSFEPDPNFINVNAYSIHLVGETEFVSFFGSQGRAISYRNQSTNNEWINTNENIYSTRVNDITSNDNYLFVAHADSVISRIQLSHFGITTDVESLNEIPQNYLLSQNYPNPFNPSTIINFSIPKQSNVSLKVYDVLGKEVAELVNSELSKGLYKINFDAANLSSGIYFYTLKTNEFISTRKMLLVK